jgi:ribosomal-protein-alanine N-acetyltransferase
MKIFAETERLILRELLPSDDKAMFELDSDPEVHRYLGSRPAEQVSQSRDVIRNIRQQYMENGIGRWAVIGKSTGIFIGWAGLKLVKQQTNGHVDFYDLGYRLIRKYWGNGFASEAAAASVNYGFKTLKLKEITGTADMDNLASRRVLEKAGLRYIETFDDDGYAVGWYRLTKEEWDREVI